ncbi:PspC domain protein [Corynebacterium kalinowskii]|uniref:PspC domain protein n=1 Tax=Corynebacterium kalinowskii TaxID=2675216 RepID=A0A6B8V9I9_9CORY|nr:PspC domain-containing protein [Corynebacterium kalinowskii]QGU01762.1 PspC domain protein [Corynebacterium kalinowskii]
MTTPQGNFDPSNQNDFSKLDGTIPFLSRKLNRSKTNSMLFGVLGGIAETYGIDATLLRLVFVLSVFFFPAMALLYAAAAVLMWNT